MTLFSLLQIKLTNTLFWIFLFRAVCSSNVSVLLVDGSRKLLASQLLQPSHFFRVGRAGFSLSHQIFMESGRGEAGFPPAFLSTNHLTSIPSSPDAPLISGSSPPHVIFFCGPLLKVNL